MRAAPELRFYLDAAYEALCDVERLDPSSALALRKVIDFLASEARTQPQLIQNLYE